MTRLSEATMRAIIAWDALTYEGSEAAITEQEREWENARDALHAELQSLGIPANLIQRMGAVI